MYSKSLYNLSTRINIVPESPRPYELEYTINIHDEGFKNRLINLQSKNIKIVVRQFLFLFNIELGCPPILATSGHLPMLWDLYLVDTPATISFTHKWQVEKCKKKFEKVLTRFLCSEEKKYVKLMQEKDFLVQ